MVQLNILSGKMAGGSWSARLFPVRIGRSSKADLQIEENGVWDEHVQIELSPAEGFRLRTQPNAVAIVNSQPTNDVLLRNGDLIQIGSSKMQFWLSETRQRGLRTREFLTWFALAALCAGQILLIYALLS